MKFKLGYYEDDFIIIDVRNGHLYTRVKSRDSGDKLNMSLNEIEILLCAVNHLYEKNLLYEKYDDQLEKGR